MELKKINHKLTVCKVTELKEIKTDSDFYFIGKTDEELSLVCKTFLTSVHQGKQLQKQITLFSRPKATNKTNFYNADAIHSTTLPWP